MRLIHLAACVCTLVAGCDGPALCRLNSGVTVLASPGIKTCDQIMVRDRRVMSVYGLQPDTLAGWSLATRADDAWHDVLIGPQAIDGATYCFTQHIYIDNVLLGVRHSSFAHEMRHATDCARGQPTAGHPGWGNADSPEPGSKYWQINQANACGDPWCTDLNDA